MTTQDYLELIRKLFTRTEAGSVNWHPTSDETEFVVYFDEFSLSMRMYRDDQDPDSCVFTIRGSTGNEVAKFWLEELYPAEWPLAEGLYNAAKRKALRVDDALQSIMRELDGSKTVGLAKAPPHPKKDDDLPF